VTDIESALRRYKNELLERLPPDVWSGAAASIERTLSKARGFMGMTLTERAGVLYALAQEHPEYRDVAARVMVAAARGDRTEVARLLVRDDEDFLALPEFDIESVYWIDLRQ
jgi:hypothetical protein